MRKHLSAIAVIALLSTPWLASCSTRTAAPAAVAPTNTATTPAQAKEPAMPADGNSMELVLLPRQQADLGSGTLRYARMLEDSRCPPKMQCVWAGDAVIELVFTPAGGAAETFQLHTGKSPREQAVAGGTLHLVQLGREAAPAAKFRFEPAS